MATRIGIAGITGRMGHLLVEEVRTAGAEPGGRHRPPRLGNAGSGGVALPPTSVRSPPHRMS